jgi:hypothetical protein
MSPADSTRPEPAEIDVRGARKHGHPLHSTWQSWRKLLDRCRDDGTQYPHHAHVRLEEPAWVNFDQFVADMGLRPPGCSIHRLDASRGYSALNCAWVDRRAQNQSQARCVRLELPGIRGALTIDGWAELFDADPYAIEGRLRQGWSLDRAVDTPTRRGYAEGRAARLESRRRRNQRYRHRPGQNPTSGAEVAGFGGGPPSRM